MNLPEAVKGALFARYSRSPKSLRRLFLDEFADAAAAARRRLGGRGGAARAEELYERIFLEYGDDSVAQLGGAHLACEQSSQLLAKVLERGRLAAYLEQSTRYVPYDDRPGGRWRYITPPEIADAERARADVRRPSSTVAFETYARWLGPMQDFFRGAVPAGPGRQRLRVPRRRSGRRRATPCAACCPPRPLRTWACSPPASPTSSCCCACAPTPAGGARLRGPDAARAAQGDPGVPHPGGPSRSRAGVVLVPGRHARAPSRPGARPCCRTAGADGAPTRPEVTLTDFDPDGEVKVVAACLYEASDLPDAVLLERARRMGAEERLSVLRAAVGERTNRRHKPGRGFERTDYRFDVLCDYGAFRDLQRHRLLTIQWQRLTARPRPRHARRDRGRRRARRLATA